MNEETAVFFSRFAFIFIIYSVISSGYISEVLSCQMQHFMKTSKIARHVLGVLMVLVFIMMEGGWSFDQKLDDEAPTNWASGNVMNSTIMAIAIYLIFLVSSKSQLAPNIIFFSFTFILYFINTQRAYWLARKKITEDTNKQIINFEIFLLIICVCSLLYGFVDYVMYQQKNYGNKFSWAIFLIGTTQCASVH